MRIGELALRAGVGVETVRYYERRGLLPRPPRRASGYREYPPEDLARLQFIRHAKSLGFTLPEIQDLLSFQAAAGSSCREVRHRLQAKITGLRSQVRTLQQILELLEGLAARCEGCGEAEGCPTLQVLEGPAPTARRGARTAARVGRGL